MYASMFKETMAAKYLLTITDYGRRNVAILSVCSVECHLWAATKHEYIFSLRSIMNFMLRIINR
jgi:hypothetical protein